MFIIYRLILMMNIYNIQKFQKDFWYIEGMNIYIYEISH